MSTQGINSLAETLLPLPAGAVEQTEVRGRAFTSLTAEVLGWNRQTAAQKAAVTDGRLKTAFKTAATALVKLVALPVAMIIDAGRFIAFKAKWIDGDTSKHVGLDAVSRIFRTIVKAPLNYLLQPAQNFTKKVIADFLETTCLELQRGPENNRALKALETFNIRVGKELGLQLAAAIEGHTPAEQVEIVRTYLNALIDEVRQQVKRRPVDARVFPGETSFIMDRLIVEGYNAGNGYIVPGIVDAAFRFATKQSTDPKATELYEALYAVVGQRNMHFIRESIAHAKTSEAKTAVIDQLVEKGLIASQHRASVEEMVSLSSQDFDLMSVEDFPESDASSAMYELNEEIDFEQPLQPVMTIESLVSAEAAGRQRIQLEADAEGASVGSFIHEFCESLTALEREQMAAFDAVRGSANADLNQINLKMVLKTLEYTKLIAENAQIKFKSAFNARKEKLKKEIATFREEEKNIEDMIKDIKKMIPSLDEQSIGDIRTRIAQAHEKRKEVLEAELKELQNLQKAEIPILAGTRRELDGLIRSEALAATMAKLSINESAKIHIEVSETKKSLSQYQAQLEKAGESLVKRERELVEASRKQLSIIDRIIERLRGPKVQPSTTPVAQDDADEFKTAIGEDPRDIGVKEDVESAVSTFSVASDLTSDESQVIAGAPEFTVEDLLPPERRGWSLNPMNLIWRRKQ